MEILEFDSLHKLAKAARRNVAIEFSADEKYSAEQANELLRAQFNLLAPDYKGFRRNQNAIFELIEETIDDVLPARVMDQYLQFADVKVLAQGDKAVFRQRITEAARKRAKTFVTKVGLAGRYETFMLDGREVEVQMGAVGAACRLGFEEFLDGRVSFADFTDIILEGMDDYIYAEIAKALAAAVKELPTVNTVTASGFDEKSMDRLLMISDSYFGGASTIYCTFEFAAQMIPSDARMSGDMKSTLWDRGFLGNYKGHQVVILKQSMVDATNAEKVIDPSNAYIIPSGSEKPVKLAFEGPTAVKTVGIENNDDWSQDIQTYKKFGIAVIMNPAICHYKNTSLTKNVA